MFDIHKLIDARKEKHITQKQIAEFLKIPIQQYSRYENEINEIPVRYLSEICKRYSISADWLFGLTEK